MRETTPASLTDDARLKKWKLENSQLKTNFETLKSTYSQLQESYEILAEKFKALEEDKDSHKNVVNEWKQQLEAKAAEFDELRLNLPPPLDISTIRMQILSEFQEDASAKWNQVTDECSKWRDLYTNVRKDHEAFKIQVEDKERAYRAALEDLHASHQEEMLVLAQKLSEKNEALGNVSSRLTADEQVTIARKLGELQRENGSLELRNKSLLAELNDSKISNTEVFLQKEKELQNVKKQMISLKNSHDVLCSEKDMLKQTEELRMEKRRSDEVSQQNSRLSAELKEQMYRQRSQK